MNNLERKELLKNLKARRRFKYRRLIANYLFPARCPFCGKTIAPSEYFCETDKTDLNDKFNLLNEPIDGVYSYCLYDDKSRDFVLDCKDGADLTKIEAAAKLLYDTLSNALGEFNSVDLIACVPSRKSALTRRGYSFPDLLAKNISELSGVPYSESIFFPEEERAEQKGLNALMRSENLIGAFKLRRVGVKGSTILLIDDVATTGATLTEAAKVLEENGANVVKTTFAKR